MRANCKQRFDNLHWYILGTGPKKKELEDSIQENKMAEHFHYRDLRRTRSLYESSRFICTAKSFGRVFAFYLEARVLACPTVATFAAAGEQMTDGVTATLCQADVESLAAAIIKHLKNPEVSKQYRKELSTFSFDKVNADIINRIEALL